MHAVCIPVWAVNQIPAVSHSDNCPDHKRTKWTTEGERECDGVVIHPAEVTGPHPASSITRKRKLDRKPNIEGERVKGY